MILPSAMKNLLLFLSTLIFAGTAFSQNRESDPRAYALYTGDGTILSFDSALVEIGNNDVLLFGELHNSSIIHWLQLRMLKNLAAMKKDFVMGGEFMERDDQTKIDEYLAGWITAKQFGDAARFWNNYTTDYKPLLEFAKENNLPFIATNIPRRYAAMVAQWGPDTLKYLPKESRQYLPKMPYEFDIDTPGYREMLDMMGAHGDSNSGLNMVKAQAIKDATMAESISENLPRKGFFFHINGDYHSAKYGGIYHYLTKANKKLNVFVIKVYSSEDLSFQEAWKHSGDLIVVVPDDFSKSY